VNYSLGTSPTFVPAGDFNGGGKPDLAVADYYSFCISILLGSGDGYFKPPVNHATGGQPVLVAVGGFNRDGKPDLAVANQNTRNVVVLINTRYRLTA
jgi:hypothetical protein